VELGARAFGRTPPRSPSPWLSRGVSGTATTTVDPARASRPIRLEMEFTLDARVIEAGVPAHGLLSDYFMAAYSME
jgi:hypothetical protein